MHCLSFSLHACATVAPWVLQQLLVSQAQAPAECHLSGLDRCMALLNIDPTGSHFSLLSMHECHTAFKCCWRQQGIPMQIHGQCLLLAAPSQHATASRAHTDTQPSAALMYKSVEMSCQLEPMTNVSSSKFSLTANCCQFRR